ncbi:hypothetical protein Ciccas_006696 [Cichlidogyrus casuarinus]|uniref:Uncharacterized protein n=1 Tax=Cichlidogyrus casuarinus TaxID=1844966 RepID=A0ABD2Q525_9PLAT
MESKLDPCDGTEVGNKNSSKFISLPRSAAPVTQQRTVYTSLPQQISSTTGFVSPSPLVNQHTLVHHVSQAATATTPIAQYGGTGPVISTVPSTQQMIYLPNGQLVSMAHAVSPTMAVRPATAAANSLVLASPMMSSPTLIAPHAQHLAPGPIMLQPYTAGVARPFFTVGTVPMVQHGAASGEVILGHRSHALPCNASSIIPPQPMHNGQSVLLPHYQMHPQLAQQLVVMQGNRNYAQCSTAGGHAVVLAGSNTMQPVATAGQVIIP